MAKKKEVVAEANATNDVYASFFETELAEAAKLMGRSNILVDDEAKARKYGLPIPCLPLQYILSSDVLMMEHLILLAGKPKMHKSSFAFEVARWVMQAGGYSRLYDTELKYSPGLAESLFGNIHNKSTWQVRTCDSMDIWQQSFSKDLQMYREHFRPGEPPKRGQPQKGLLPFCLIIDSLTGRSSEDAIEAYDKEGKAPNVTGMRNAKMITDFLQIQNFMHLPAYVIMIRHEKDSSAPSSFMGAKAKQTPGGAAPDFMGSVDLRFKVIGRERLEDEGWNIVEIKCQKNAFGPDQGRFAVRFAWKYMLDENGEKIQVPKWEWDLATAEFLAGYDRSSIKDIANVVRSGSKNNPLFTCRQLGLVEVSGQDLGMAVRQDEKLMRSLQTYLNIKHYAIFDPYMYISDNKKPVAAEATDDSQD